MRVCSVDDALLMGSLECLGDLQSDSERPFERNRTFADAGRQGLVLHQLHGDGVGAALLFQAVNAMTR